VVICQIDYDAIFIESIITKLMSLVNMYHSPKLLNYLAFQSFVFECT